MYAIVDIETTGGYASGHGITEVAIILHDGVKVVGHFETLVNPGIPIPVYITALTGINDEMVKSAPSFNEVAAEIYSLISDKIFVAHNVNFDYSFLKHQLSRAGFDLQCKKLCTVRLSRKIFPGMQSYSLGKLCRQLGIASENRHRAGGDALSTAELFSLLMQNDREGHLASSLNRNSKEHLLPLHLNKADLENLPSAPGVYYFADNKGKVIYVGKAVNIRKRVLSHFTGHNAGRQRQEFLKNIYSVRHSLCGTELMAFILEAVEIKRLWPAGNRAMKRFEQAYGLYQYEDQKGYIRLVLDKKRKNSMPLFACNSMSDGRQLLIGLIKRFELCPTLCFIQRSGECGSSIQEYHCKGACSGTECADDYNKRVFLAMEMLKTGQPSFMVVDKGRTENERSVILVEEGWMKGMGYIPGGHTLDGPDSVRSLLNVYPSNDYIRNLVLNYAARFPGKVVAGQ